LFSDDHSEPPLIPVGDDDDFYSSFSPGNYIWGGVSLLLSEHDEIHSPTPRVINIHITKWEQMSNYQEDSLTAINTMWVEDFH
jgi:hypothetical protein